MKLTVFFGGMSTEHNISCISAGNIISNLDKEKYDIKLVGIDKKGKWFKYTGDIETIKENKWIEDILNKEEVKDIFALLSDTDVAFPVLHGKYGEDGTIQGLFELARVKYVGCNIFASSAGMDKVYTKILADLNGVPVVPYIQVLSGDKITDELMAKVKNEIGYPLIVKPSRAGSSFGVNKVNKEEDFKEAITNSLQHDSKILIEKCINAREIEIAVLGNREIIVSQPGEIIPANEFYDFDAKYNSSASIAKIPADISEEMSEKIREYASKVYKAIDASGLSRVDFFISKDDNKIYFNEVNTLPGFTSISMYPKLMDYIGIEYKDLLDRLITLADEKEYKA